VEEGKKGWAVYGFLAGRRENIRERREGERRERGRAAKGERKGDQTQLYHGKKKEN